jgi:hypothetical protein
MLLFILLYINWFHFYCVIYVDFTLALACRPADRSFERGLARRARVCVCERVFSEKMLGDTEILFLSLLQIQIQLTSHSIQIHHVYLKIYILRRFIKYIFLSVAARVIITINYHVFLTSPTS